MKSFLVLTITEEEGPFRVCRTRTSAGFASITIQAKGKCILSLTNEGGNDMYEQDAFALAELINKIASDPCALPKESK